LKERYTITDNYKTEEYLDIHLEHTDNNIRMSQPLIIERINDVIQGMRQVNAITYPALPSTILIKNKDGTERKENCNY